MTKIPMIDNPLGGRSVKEWVGKTPDSMPPQTVRVRIFDRAKGLCHITGTKIMPGDEWDAEHVKRLADGGENRELNLAPALRKPHRVKTAAENKAGKKATRARAKHIGASDVSKNPIKSRGFEPVEKVLKPSSKVDQIRALRELKFSAPRVS